MFSRLAGIWFALLAIAGWTFVCIALAISFVRDPLSATLLVVLWLLIVAPLGRALMRERRRR